MGRALPAMNRNSGNPVFESKCLDQQAQMAVEHVNEQESTALMADGLNKLENKKIHMQ